MNTYEIHVQDIIHNINVIKEKAGDCNVIGVIKGNGYGFGTEYMASLLKSEGISHFAVTEITDAEALRKTALPENDILLLRSTCLEDEAEKIVANNCIATVGSLDSARVLNDAARKLNTKVQAHIKIDTGMSRYGFTSDEIKGACSQLKAFESIEYCGIYTHFSSAFTHARITKKQLDAFKATVDMMKDAGFNFNMIHCANTPALFNVDGVTNGMTAVRIGSGFTGRVVTQKPSGLKRAGMLKGQVIEIKSVCKGTAIGYNGALTAKKDMRLAIVPVGHFDGFGIEKGQDVLTFKTTVRSMLSLLKRFLIKERLMVKINGKKYPVAGHIGLSHTALDITSSDVKTGDEAEFDISPLLANPSVKRIYK